MNLLIRSCRGSLLAAILVLLLNTISSASKACSYMNLLIRSSRSSLLAAIPVLPLNTISSASKACSYLNSRIRQKTHSPCHTFNGLFTQFKGPLHGIRVIDNLSLCFNSIYEEPTLVTHIESIEEVFHRQLYPHK